MKLIRWNSPAFAAAVLLTTALPATASNLSDITGPNVSDITGPNVSDITGPNVSDITGTNAEAQKRAIIAGRTQADLDQLAYDLTAAHQVCSGGGDCSTFHTLLEQAKGILYGHDQ